MKKLLLILFLFKGVNSIAQIASTLVVTIPEANVLDTLKKRVVNAMIFTTRTYGTTDNNVYYSVNGTATGGSMGLTPDSLASYKRQHYIIQRDSGLTTAYFYTTIKIKTPVSNILDFYSKLQAYLVTQGYTVTQAQLTALSTLVGNKANQSDLNATNSNVSANTNAIGTKLNKNGVNGISSKPTFIDGQAVTLDTLKGTDIWRAQTYVSEKQLTFTSPLTRTGNSISFVNPGYITSYTEIDPTVSAYSKSLTAFSVIKTSTDPLYASLTGSYVNPSWIISLPYTKITGTPTIYAFSGTSSQYTKGDGTYSNLPTYATVATTGSYSDLINKPTIYSFTGNSSQYTLGNGLYVEIPTYSTVASTGSYNDLLNKPTIPTQYTDALARAAISNGSGIGYSPTTGIITNTLPDQTVTLTAGNRILISGTYPNFTIAYVEPTNHFPTRTLNSNFTISTTLGADTYYTITCSTTNPLLVGSSTATATLQYSTNAGSTWQNVTQNGQSSAVGVTVTLQLTSGETGLLGGYIPANALVKIVTATTGTASATLVSSVEKY